MSRRAASGASATRYADLATARLIDEHLAGVVCGADALAPQRAWWAMTRAVRNLGRPGISAMAISAVDVALWDLKARLLELPLATLLGAVHEQVPVYGSGGFTSYSHPALAAAAGRLGAGGDPAREDEDRQPPARRPRARAGGARGDRRGRGAVRGRQRRLRAQAGAAQAERFAAQASVSWFEEPVSSEDLDGLRLLRDRAPAGMEIAAGEYGYEPAYFQRMLAAGAVDVMQADGTRCGGITGLLAVGRALPGPPDPVLGALRPAAARPRVLRDRAAAPPRVLPRPRPHRATALRRRPRPRATARCDPTRRVPASGIELKARDAEDFAA